MISDVVNKIERHVERKEDKIFEEYAQIFGDTARRDAPSINFLGLSKIPQVSEKLNEAIQKIELNCDTLDKKILHLELAIVDLYKEMSDNTKICALLLKTLQQINQKKGVYETFQANGEDNKTYEVRKHSIWSSAALAAMSAVRAKDTSLDYESLMLFYAERAVDAKDFIGTHVLSMKKNDYDHKKVFALVDGHYHDPSNPVTSSQMEYILAKVYYEDRDLEEAKKHAKAAADKNYTPASFIYGKLLLENKLLTREEAEQAFHYLRKAADQHFMLAVTHIAHTFTDPNLQTYVTSQDIPRLKQCDYYTLPQKQLLFLAEAHSKCVGRAQKEVENHPFYHWPTRNLLAVIDKKRLQLWKEYILELEEDTKKPSPSHAFSYTTHFKGATIPAEIAYLVWTKNKDNYTALYLAQEAALKDDYLGWYLLAMFADAHNEFELKAKCFNHIENPIQITPSSKPHHYYVLGLMYAHKATEKDKTDNQMRALHYFRKAAIIAGHPGARYQYATYLSNSDVYQDLYSGSKQYKKKGVKDDPFLQKVYGEFNDPSTGEARLSEEERDEAANAHLTKAIDGGYILANLEYAVNLIRGKGLAPLFETFEKDEIKGEPNIQIALEETICRHLQVYAPWYREELDRSSYSLEENRQRLRDLRNTRERSDSVDSKETSSSSKGDSFNRYRFQALPVHDDSSAQWTYQPRNYDVDSPTKKEKTEGTQTTIRSRALSF